MEWTESCEKRRCLGRENANKGKTVAGTQEKIWSGTGDICLYIFKRPCSAGKKFYHIKV